MKLQKNNGHNLFADRKFIFDLLLFSIFHSGMANRGVEFCFHKKNTVFETVVFSNLDRNTRTEFFNTGLTLLTWLFEKRVMYISFTL